MAKKRESTGQAADATPAAAVPERGVKPTPGAALVWLPVADVIPTPDNPRRVREDDPAVAELAASIREMGLLQPVVCRPHPSQPGKYDLRAGHRRWLAHRLNGAEKILAIVRPMTEAVALEVTVLENLQRQDLTPLEEARGVRSLLLSGMSAEDAGREIGKSARWVHGRALLTDLAEPWVTWFETQEMVREGHEPEPLALTVRHLELLVRFPQMVQERLAHEAEQEPWRLTDGRYGQFAQWIGGMTGRLTLAPWDLAEEFADGCTCLGCERRSARRQQWLFVPDGDAPAEAAADADACLDLECWARREAVWLQRREAELRQEHPDLILVAGSYPQGSARDRERLKRLEKLPVAQKGEWPECRIVGAKTKGAVPALVVYGEGLGTLVWVVFQTAGGAAKPPPGPKTLAEKRQQLELRRRVKAVAEFVEWLQGAAAREYWADLAVEEQIEDVLAFGQQRTESYRKADTWLLRQTRVDQENRTPRDRALELWEELYPVLQERLRVYGLPDVADESGWSAWAELGAQCRMLGQERDVWMAAAVADIPEPKSWGKDGAE